MILVSMWSQLNKSMKIILVILNQLILIHQKSTSKQQVSNHKNSQSFQQVRHVNVILMEFKHLKDTLKCPLHTKQVRSRNGSLIKSLLINLCRFQRMSWFMTLDSHDGIHKTNYRQLDYNFHSTCQFKSYRLLNELLRKIQVWWTLALSLF